MNREQVLIPDIHYRPCRACDGRGFLLVEKLAKTKPPKEVPHHEVKECDVCKGKGW